MPICSIQLRNIWNNSSSDGLYYRHIFMYWILTKSIFAQFKIFHIHQTATPPQFSEMVNGLQSGLEKKGVGKRDF